MTRTQHKKHLARLFNLRRDERLTYEMDRVLFPKPPAKPTASQIRNKRRAELNAAIVSAFAGGLGMPEGWNSP